MFRRSVSCHARAGRPLRAPIRKMATSPRVPPYTMNPKGQNLSFWIGRNTGTADVYPPLRSSADKFDVVVIGGGITGLTSALNLKRAGMRVAVLEQHTVGSGCSGSSTGHISLHIDTNFSKIEKNFGPQAAALVYQGQLEARDEIARNCELLKIPGFEGPQNTFIYAEKDMPQSILHDEVAALKRAGAESVRLLAEQQDIGLPFVPELAMQLPGSAQFDAHRYCQGLARAINGDGSAVYENTRVLNLKDGVPCEVQAEFGTLRPKHIISATHTPLGISILQTGMVPHLSFGLAARVERPFPPGLFYDTMEPYHYVRRLDAANPNVIIVGGADKKTGNHEPEERECYDALRLYVSRRFRVQQILAQWCAQYYPSADGLPYVGTDLGSEHIWIATGFSGDGLSLGTVAANILAKAIQGQAHPLASVYNSHRFKPIASARQFLAEQMSVAKHLVGDRLTGLGVSLDDMERGEGRIAQVGAHKVAAYRDLDGKLYAHSAVCPHMKCIVNWNASEKTFDCPCHGSRFSVTGKVLEGPALTDLEDFARPAAEEKQPEKKKTPSSSTTSMPSRTSA